MSRRSDSRDRMLDAAAELLQRQGYSATGLAEILSHSGAPRGSLYFHFPGGKEELATEAIERSAAQLREELRGLLQQMSSASEALTAVTGFLADRLEQSDFLDGCPVATVALEASGTSPRLQQVCARSYEQWLDVIETFTRHFGIEPDAARSRAWLILSAIEGALLLSRSRRDTEPLRRVGAELANLLG